MVRFTPDWNNNMQPVTVKIFLISGNPEWLRTAEISNWTGKAIASPRMDMKGFLAREELGKPDAYILAGTDPESNTLPCTSVKPNQCQEE